MTTSRKVRAGLQLFIGLAAFIYIAYCVIDVMTNPLASLNAGPCLLDIGIGIVAIGGGMHTIRRGQELDAE